MQNTSQDEESLEMSQCLHDQLFLWEARSTCWHCPY